MLDKSNYPQKEILIKTQSANSLMNAARKGEAKQTFQIRVWLLVVS